MCCQKCKTTTGTFVKIARRTLKNGTVKIAYLCNPCNADRQRKYLATNTGAAASYRSARKYAKNNPQRVKAWKLAATLGTRPCELCGEKRTDKHHPDIWKPLEVVWLCRYHHKQAHKNKETKQKWQPAALTSN